MTTKAIPQDIKDLGFTVEQFGAVADFDGFIQAILDEQEALLSGRAGAAAVSSSTLAAQVKRAEKCLAGAEMLQRRINRLSGNVDADTAILIPQLKKARQDYMDEAERIIPQLVAGSAGDGSDVAFGQSSSSHFDGASV